MIRYVKASIFEGMFEGHMGGHLPFKKSLRRVNDIIGEIPNLPIRDNDNYNAWLVTAGRVLTDPCCRCRALNQVLMTRNRHIRAGTITCHNYTQSLNKTQPATQ